MRGLHTEKMPGASVEFIVVLPLLLILAWGCALLSLLLIRESRSQQASWVYAMARTHPGTSERQAREMSRKTAGVPPSAFGVTSRADAPGWQDVRANLAASLPTSFRGALLVHGPTRHALRIEEAIPKSIVDFLTSARTVFPDRNPTLEETATGVLFRTMGDGFHDSRELRQALWQEAMFRAGFGPLPLQLLGVPELMSVLGGDLGGPGEEILKQWGRSPVRVTEVGP